MTGGRLADKGTLGVTIGRHDAIFGDDVAHKGDDQTADYTNQATRLGAHHHLRYAR